jgi:uncharacterized protein YbbK (DUF523 family)
MSATHPAGFDWTRLERVTEEDPLRVLFSACLLGNKTGWDGEASTEPLAVRLSKLACVRAVTFCPEDVSLGTPRPLTTLYDGDGRDVLRGRARVLKTTLRPVAAAARTRARVSGRGIGELGSRHRAPASHGRGGVETWPST